MQYRPDNYSFPLKKTMRKSAGILLFKKINQQLQVLLVHPGGPFWANKDLGAWSIPKGEFQETEEPLAAAVREMEEETGYKVQGPFLPLTPIKQKAGKLVMAWAVEGDFDANAIKSNTFKIQWPYKSGKWFSVPEVDKAGWFTVNEAKQKINLAQVSFIDELTMYLSQHNFKSL
jgi:predicted NUDIX family NTP pyrophosphohydrolase